MGLIDPEARRAYQREYTKRPHQLARRAKQQVKWRRRRRERIFARDGYRCHYCRAPFPYRDLTIDHKVPLYHGGPDTDDNKLTACRPCNRRKGTMSYERYMAEIDPNHVPEWITEAAG